MGIFSKGRGGADGSSHEHEAVTKTDRLKPTKAQGAPVNMTCSMRCGKCGTSDLRTGRPGSSVNEFTCRSCKTTNISNRGMGYTFPSPN